MLNSDVITNKIILIILILPIVNCNMDRSVLQDENQHIIFSDLYNNLLSFDYALDYSKYRNFAYILGSGEGTERKRTIFYNGDKVPQLLERYEVYVDAKDLSNEVQTRRLLYKSEKIIC